ncbi:MAG: SDR family oxidoreductase [Candidatus Hadarchaeota archaeon]
MKTGDVVLITGCSSGIGQSTSLFLARRGFRVYSTMRKISDDDPLLEARRRENLSLEVLKLDVTDTKSVSDAVKKIMRETGRIDVLVNNAGFGMEGPVDKTSMDDIYSQFEVNFFGLVRVTKEVVPHMLRQRTGRIVNISSGAGRISIPFNASYCASKFAVEGFSETIDYELRPHGVKVIIIEPGVMKTKFFKKMKMVARPSVEPHYSIYYRKTQEAPKHGMPPEKVSEVIYKTIVSKRPKLRYTVGRDAWAGVFFRKILPERFFRWGVRRRYLKE